MTRRKAEQIPALEGCISLVANTIANIPIRLYRTGEDGQVEEIKRDHRLFLLNNETGDTFTAADLKRELIYDYYLDGNGYAYINRNGLAIDSLNYVESRYVNVTDSVDVIFKSPVMTVQGKSYFTEDFIKLVRNTSNGVSGHGVISNNDKLLSVAYNTLEYEDTLVKTGGNKKGFIKSARKLGQAAIDALKESWSNLYSNSSENAIVLNDGLEFQEASSTSVEMQLNENKASNTADICKLFNIPPSMITGNGTEQDERNYIKFCIMPLLDKFIAEINRVMLLESEKEHYFFGADTDELVKGDIEKRFNAYQIASSTGWLQLDEIRERENMPPLGMNFVKMGLSDVLYDPNTKEVYTPNTNQLTNLEKGGQQGRE